MTDRFEELYAKAAEGRASVPWDRETPTQLVEQWMTPQAMVEPGTSAVVVGCGYGRDAELAARHGYRTVGFDIAPTAIATARDRYPGSGVDYHVADLLALPREWIGSFDLVVESMNIQALPEEVRPAAISGVRRLVAVGGTLLVVQVARDDGEVVDGPPWPMDRSEIESFGIGMRARTLERIPDESDPGISRWLAEFARDPD